MEKKGLIFDIKRFAVHDGPGIRSTVFFKGCPLHCLWCHNPEGISSGREVMVFAGRCIKGCRDCLSACAPGALRKSKGAVALDRSCCDGCGACVEKCPADALQMAGRWVDSSEVAAELAKDEPFYSDSAGGVTFSGGEPLQQAGFLRELLEWCRERNFHATVDTSGHAPFAAYESILPLVDLFLFDLKIVDERAHIRLTGVSNRLLLDNLGRLARSARALAVRVPLVPGCNDADSDLEQMADLCAALPGPPPVHILPYHRGYVGKIRRLGLDDPLAATEPPTVRALSRAADIFSRRRLTVKTGG